MPPKTKVEGTKKARRELQRLTRKYPLAVATALFQEATGIFVESQEEVPVDTGRLRSSGTVFMIPSGRVFNVFVSYGTAYAVAIHENESLDEGRQSRAELALSNPGYKPKGSTVGKSKFLQDPYERALPGILGRVARLTQRIVAQRGSPTLGTTVVRGKRKG